MPARFSPGRRVAPCHHHTLRSSLHPLRLDSRWYLRLGALGLATLCLAHLAVVALAEEEHPATPPPLSWSDFRELETRAGQTLTFDLPPLPEDPGQIFGWLEALQLGADVQLSLRLPDREEPLTVDFPKHRFGPETIVVPLPKRGARLQVRSRTRGRFRLWLRLAAPDSPALRRRIAAGRHLTRAGELAARGTGEARQQAADQLQRSVETWPEEAGPEAMAWSGFQLGHLHYELGALDAAHVETLRAIEIFRGLGNDFGIGMAENLRGLVFWAQGNVATARGAYEIALQEREAIADACGEAQTLTNLGVLELQESRPERALSFFDRALALCGEDDDPDLRLVLLLNTGGAHETLGDLERAIEFCLSALAPARALGQRATEAVIHSNLGTYYRRIGRFQEAFDSYRRALDLQEELGDRRRQGALLNNLGYAYLTLGEPSRAAGTFERALELRRQVSDHRGTASTLENLGRARQDLGLLAPALEAFEESLEIRRALDDPQGEARTLTSLGVAHLELGALDAAARALERALELQAGDPSKRAWLLLQLGRQRLAAGSTAEALRFFASALHLFREIRDPVGEARLLTARAAAERLQGDAPGALADLERTLELVEGVQASIHDPDLRATFLAVQLEAYEATIALHMELADAGRPESLRQALETAERSRARSLLTLLADSRVAPEISDSLAGHRRELEERLRSTAAGYRSMLRRRNLEQARALSRRLDELLGQLEQVESRLRSEESPGRSLSRAPVLGSRQIQALLDDETTLLQFSLGEAKSFLWVVERQRLLGFSLPPRAEIEDLTREVYIGWSTFDPGSSGAEAAAASRLGQLLLGPATAELRPGRRLVVVADGALHYLPFAALPRPSVPGEPAAPRRLLIEDHEILTLPSASVLGLQRTSRSPSSPRRRPDSIAVVADPIFSLQDPRSTARSAPVPASSTTAQRSAELEAAPPRLPATRAEADSIAELAGSETVVEILMGERALRQSILDGALARAHTIHFATHGVLDSQRPRLSGLMFSRFDASGRALDGFLTLGDIYRLDLEAELVVLSGCSTALGREIHGEGLVGLTRGFLYAGATRVVASLWRVQDGATAQLMTGFYRALLEAGQRPAAALRTAQLALLRSSTWRDPYFWAAFVHYGEWR